MAGKAGKDGRKDQISRKGKAVKAGGGKIKIDTLSKTLYIFFD